MAHQPLFGGSNMADNFIRNREGKIIGRQDGNLLRNGQGQIIAKYDVRSDMTRTGNGKIVGKGNQMVRELGK